MTPYEAESYKRCGTDHRKVENFFLFFLHIIRRNGQRGIRFYTRIHDLDPEEINQIIQHCNLSKWRINSVVVEHFAPSAKSNL